ncbi:MAG: response regulator [Bdellovibrionales bacterium]|nr:response regulator [Bdellovibrionales bacterium]
MRVLIIDDETLIRKSLMRVALSRGHTVRAEKDGERGLHTWKVFQPHLVFLDILMPKLDGPSVLRKAGKKNNEKIIMMSAHRAFSDDIPVPGVDLFLSKPFRNVIDMFKQAEQLCFYDKEISI